MRIVVVSHDVVPGMAVPVAAPGLRAWGLALGLRAHGHTVTVVVPPNVAAKVWTGDLPPAVPPGVVLLAPKLLGDYVRTQQVEAVVVSTPSLSDAVVDLPCPVVYDFFAPRVLELAENTGRVDQGDALERLTRHKLRVLARADAVVVNGAKKLDYVHDWLGRARDDLPPVRVVNPGVPFREPEPVDDGDLHLMVGGYLQPWSRAGEWVTAALTVIEEGGARLHLLLGSHWGQVRTNVEVAPELARLAAHPSVTTHGLLRFGDFRRLVGRCHLTVDVFARNPERELAMVTRSVVALAGGVPVLHVPFTEVSPWIDRYDGGWLVEEDDDATMTDVLRTARDRGTADRAAGARRIATELLDPATAVAPLVEVLSGL